MLKVILNSIILFSIVYSQSLEITAPNGNETIYNNDDYTIQWITSGNISPVDLSWSDDGGATFTAFQQYMTNTEGAGSFVWTIPNHLGVNADYRIKIFDSSTAEYNDMSDASFTIETYDIGCTDIYEANNEISAGEVITLGQTYNGCISSFSDIDYFSFSLSTTGTLTINLANTNNALSNSIMYLYKNGYSYL